MLIFSEKSTEAEKICDCGWLGVDVVSIHSGLNQHDRWWAIQGLKDGHKDVLVAMDLVSKGLHFEDVQL